MLDIALMVAFGVVALLFFTAERALGLFPWSRLEEVELPRRRRNAVTHCLEERELVSADFIALGALASALLAVLLATKISGLGAAMTSAACVVLLLVWPLSETLAWRFRDMIVFHVAPLLYGVTGTPFRVLRRLFLSEAQRPLESSNDKEADGVPVSEAPDAEAREVFREMVRLRHTQLREILTPRTDMVSLEESSTLREAFEVSLKTGFSRLPVYRANRDHIVGVLHVKDLLSYAATDRWDKPILREIMRPPMFVPETKVVSELLEEMLKTQVHLAVVLDEYGGTGGLVSLEDIIEQLVGDIRDEYENPKEEVPVFRWVNDRSAEVQAIMRIEEFNETFRMDLPEDDDFDTVGGFVTCVLGRIPAKGESLTTSRAKVTVLDADPRRVKRVRVDFAQAPSRQIEG